MERREDQSRVPEKPLGGRAPESSRQKAQFHQAIWLDVFFSCPRPPPHHTIRGASGLVKSVISFLRNKNYKGH